MARRFKILRIEKGLSAHTVAGNLNKLSVIWRKWFVEECGVVAENPWEKIEHPKADKLQPRVIGGVEQAPLPGMACDAVGGLASPGAVPPGEGVDW